MYILTPEIKSEFISGLKPRYARCLPTKKIANIGDIEFAATNLYAYGTPFLKLGKRRQPHYGVGSILVLRITLKGFIKLFYDDFHNPCPRSQVDFDKIHEELCNQFLHDIAVGGVYTHTYGNAQKMVNMLFKYCVCFEDAVSYEEHFKYCHMTIDRYIYNGYTLPFYKDVVYPTIHGTTAGKLGSWTSIPSYKDYKSIADDIIFYIIKHPKTYNDYLDICHHLYVLPSVPKLSSIYFLTPFEAEFFIWTICKAVDEFKKIIKIKL